jgi:hypothetical protein
MFFQNEKKKSSDFSESVNGYIAVDVAHCVCQMENSGRADSETQKTSEWEAFAVIFYGYSSQKQA